MITVDHRKTLPPQLALPTTESAAITVLQAWVAFLAGDLALSTDLLDTLSTLPPDQIDSQTYGRTLILQAWQAITYPPPNVSNPALAFAQAALPLLKTDPWFRQVAWLCLGHAQRYSGATCAASATYRLALAQTPQPSATLNRCLLTSLALNLNDQGRRNAALHLCATSASTAAPDPLALAHAVLAYEANDLLQARSAAIQGCAALQHGISDPMLCLAAERVAILASAALGEWETAWQHLALARQLHGAWPWFSTALNALEAELWLRHGDLKAAQRWATSTGLTPNDLIAANEEPIYLTYARLLVIQGEYHNADLVLSHLETATLNGSRRALLISVRLLQTLLAAQHSYHSALPLLAEAVQLAAADGYVRRFLDAGPRIPQLLALLPTTSLSDPEQRRFVATILDSTTPPDQQPTPAFENDGPLVEPLSDQELAVLHLLADGLSNSAIAERLQIAIGTVKWHIHNLYAKLGVTGRMSAVVRSRALHLL
jgi:LuxR family maltose regulon positive regulatory protein